MRRIRKSELASWGIDVAPTLPWLLILQPPIAARIAAAAGGSIDRSSLAVASLVFASLWQAARLGLLALRLSRRARREELALTRLNPGPLLWSEFAPRACVLMLGSAPLIDPWIGAIGPESIIVAIPLFTSSWAIALHGFANLCDVEAPEPISALQKLPFALAVFACAGPFLGGGAAIQIVGIYRGMAAIRDETSRWAASLVFPYFIWPFYIVYSLAGFFALWLCWIRARSAYFRFEPDPHWFAWVYDKPVAQS